MLATVLRVQDLRDVGVTLHVYVDLNIHIAVQIRTACLTDNCTPNVPHSKMYPRSTLSPLP